MHSSERINRFSRSRRRSAVTVILIAAIFYLVLKLLDLVLYPCTFMRNDMHAVVSSEYEDLIVGTSCGKMNIDPAALESITDRRGHNACVGGEYAVDAYYISRLAADRQNPTRIIYEIGPGYFVTEKEEGNNYLLFYHEFPSSLIKAEYFLSAVSDIGIRSTLFPWTEYSLSYELPLAADNVRKKLSSDYSTEDLKTEAQTYYENGFIGRNPVDLNSLSWSNPILFDKNSVVEENISWLKKLILFCQSSGIEFVAVTTPMPAASLAAYPEAYNDAWEYFEELFADMGVSYLNFNTQLYDAFSHELDGFTDFDGHMNEETARRFSEVLGRALNGEDVLSMAEIAEPVQEAVPVG